MHIRLASDNDEDKWNHFASRHPQVTPYHHFAWKKAIEEAYGHQCYYLIAESADMEIVGILPTVALTPPFVSGKLCALPFCDIGASLVIDSSVEKQLIDEAIKVSLQKKLPVFEYRASQQYRGNDGTTEPLTNAHKVRMLMELPETSETLLASFKPKLRSQIKKAVKNGLTFELGRSDQLIDEFYDVFSFNMKALGSPTHSKSWFSEIRNNYAEDMVVSVIKHDGYPVGAGIVLFSGSIASIPWASTRREFNRLSPNMLLYWSLLEYATDHGFKTFDFGRSSYGEGTYRFKQQWGTRPVPLNWKTFKNGKQIEVAADSTNTHEKNTIRPLIEKLWRMLPLPVTVAIGSRVRKYISL